MAQGVHYVGFVSAQDDAAALQRCSDLDRDAALNLLSVATSDGRLSVEEHHEKMSMVLASKTRGELAAITCDLGGAPQAPVRPERSLTKVRAIFGQKKRGGSGDVPSHLEATATFGGVVIDLTTATFASKTTTMRLSSYFGEVILLVPDGVEVIDHGSAIFGERCEPPSSTIEAVSTIEIFGRACFGQVVIKRSSPGQLPR